MDEMMLMYIFAGTMWTFYATRKQINLSPSISNLIISSVLNLCFWPIAIVIATCRNV